MRFLRGVLGKIKEAIKGCIHNLGFVSPLKHRKVDNFYLAEHKLATSLLDSVTS
jgi:hypothetical protein